MVEIVHMGILDTGDHLVELFVGIEPAIVPRSKAVEASVQEGILLLRAAHSQ